MAAIQKLVQLTPPRPEPDTSRRNLEALIAELRKRIEGEVRFDDGSRAMYATDASNYRQTPIGVVIPKSAGDVVRTVAACRRHRLPILSRGGGTSLAGQCCNAAVVIDWSKYLNRILDLKPEEKYARVEPGTVCDTVRNAAKPHGVIWGPDPATHNHCTFGGMLGNNSCGTHAQMAGKAVANTEEMKVLLYDGTIMTVGWMDDRGMKREIARGGRIGGIYKALLALRKKYEGQIRKRYPNIPRRVSGYNLDELIPGEDGRFNLARALVGSESTCVTILEAKVRLVPSRPQRVLLLLGYPSVYEAGDHVPELLKFNPIALEGHDVKLNEKIKKKQMRQIEDLDVLPEGKGWLIVEFGAETLKEAEAQAHKAMAAVGGPRLFGAAPSMKLCVEEKEQKRVWNMREAGLGSTAFVPGEPLAWEGWEDSAVAPEKVGAYLRDLRRLFDKYDYDSVLYGHFGQGCIHCRIDFDLFSVPGIKKWRAFMEEATDLIVSYGGSYSGEHGDGQSKAEFLDKMFGPELIEAFREFKAIWDPDGRMNPGKIVGAYRMDENLRLGADYAPWDPQTHFSFPDDHGSFAHAALRCVGVGKCRRTKSEGEQDTMCPSFMVTREERHSTRGRTHLLFEMMNGGTIKDKWRSEEVKEALDLCLSCKGCKSDCPVNVDMATYKAEFLSHYWEGRLRPRSAYAFGWIDQWARLASKAPGLVNLVTQLPGTRSVAKLMAGMPQRREIPAFAPQTFKAWFAEREPGNLGGPKVVLWGDTFNNYFLPETAQAAVNVLEHAGYHVVVPPEHLCCGRPLYDYGFLDLAKAYLQRTLKALEPRLEAETPMVVLEPSCCSVFRDEMPALMANSAAAQRLAAQTLTLAELLENRTPGYQPPRIRGRAVAQGHCHHKAVMRFKEERTLLEKTGLDFELLETGCCGMAGSFGFESDKMDVSLACGERALLPRVRQEPKSSFIMADGFSCKTQIAQTTDRQALHLAEVLDLAIRQAGAPPFSQSPETEMVEKKNRLRREAMARAGAATAGVAAASALAWWWLRRHDGI